MKTLKKTISNYMYQITTVSVALMLFVVLFVQLISEQKRAYEHSIQTFELINSRLEENEQELSVIKEEYKQTCLYNAEMISDIIINDPDILNDLEEMRNLAKLLEIDEIHIFDKTGRIFMGTHPEYYDYTFDSGEQMMFFKPMLKDKSLKLVQDITPNTAEGKLMQYSAIWSKNGEYIIQVGMEPVNVNKVTKKNEISYIFSTFKINPGEEFFDIDASDGTVIGSTNTSSIRCRIDDLGIDFDKIKKDANGFHARVNGQVSFCFFQKTGNTYLGRVITIRNLYQRIPSSMLVLSVCLILIGFTLAYTVTKHLNRYVVDEIHDINGRLDRIANGKFDESIEVRSSTELSELCDYINTMLKSILDNNIKMSYVLNKTNLLIGVYEYNDTMSRVRFTEYVPQIFSMTSDEIENLSSDIERFQHFINEMHNSPVPEEPNVYAVGEKYVKLDEIRTGADVFGVVMDVTSEITKQKTLKTERDIDLLTGLFNRRGLDTRLTELFANPDTLEYYALIMIDADGLKMVNDTYGHEGGDSYLKKLAAVIENWGTQSSIASRLGGDEFVLFLYGYPTEDELKKALETLEYVQDNSLAQIDDSTSVPLKFSLGYILAKGEGVYQKMLKEADEKMYQNKVSRRNHANSGTS